MFNNKGLVVALCMGWAFTSQAILNAPFNLDASGSRPGVWTLDLVAARNYAKNNNSPYLIYVFGDTVGCSNCKKAKDHAFSEREFLDHMVAQNVPLVYFDSGKSWTLPAEANALASYYNVSSLPHVVVVKSSDGKTPWSTRDANNALVKGSFLYRDGYTILGYTVDYPVLVGTQPDTVSPGQLIRIIESFVYGLEIADSADPTDDSVTNATALAMMPINQTAQRTLSMNDTDDWFAVTNMVEGLQYRVGVTGVRVVNAEPRISFYTNYAAALSGNAWKDVALPELTNAYTYTATAEHVGTNYIRVSRPAASNADVGYTLNYRIFETCKVGLVTPLPVDEDASNVVVYVTREGRLTDAVTVSYSSINQTATAGQDYDAVSGSLYFSTNQTTNQISVRLRYNVAAPDFGDESFGLNLTTTNEVTLDPVSATVVLRDVDKQADDYDTGDDLAGGATRVTMDVTNRMTSVRYLSAADTSDWYVFTNIQTGAPYRVSVTQLMVRDSNPEIRLYTTNTVAGGFSAASALTSLAGLTNGFVFVSDDAAVTNGLWLHVSRTADANAAVRYVLNYREWPAPGIGFATAVESVGDNRSSVTLAVRRTVNVDADVSVAYQTVNGSALANTDYEAKAGILRFRAGDTAEQTVTLQITDDHNVWRGDRSFYVDLLPAAGVALGLARCEVQITETNAAAADARDTRAGGDATSETATSLAMTRANQTLTGLMNAEDTGDWFVFTNVVRGSDYRVSITDLSAINASNLVASFYVAAPAGGIETSAWLSVDLPLDALSGYFFSVPEEMGGAWDGKVWLALTRDSGTRVNVGYTLNYREWVPCEIGFETGSVTVSEAASEVALRVRRTRFAEIATSAVITLHDGSATAGDDYVATQMTLIWPAADTNDVKTIRIPLRNFDSRWEGDETFTVALEPDPNSATAGAITNVIVTLTDKDTPVAGQIAFAGYGAENKVFSSASRIAAKEGEAVVFWLVRSAGHDGAVTTVLTCTDGTGTTSQTNVLWQSLESGLKRVEVVVPERVGYQAPRPVTLKLTAQGVSVVKGKDAAALTVTDSAVTLPLTAYVAADRSRVPFRATAGAWFGTADGTVLRCIPPAKGAASVMQATVTGAGILVFDAAIISGDETCAFTVKVGSQAVQAVVVGENQVSVPAGTQTVTWSFKRGAASSADAYAQISNIRWESADSRETLGSFNGYAWRILEGAEEPQYGLAAMTVAASGKISGKLQFGGKTYTFASPGYVPGTFLATNVLAKAGTEQVAVSITVDGASGCVEIADEGETLGAVLHRNGWGDKPLSVPRMEAMSRTEGYYTAVLPDAVLNTNDVFGSGYVALTVAPNGSVKIAGKLADGKAVSLSGTLLLGATDAPYAMLFTAPADYRGGYAGGTLLFVTNGTGVAVLTGGAVWCNRNGQATGTGGFERTLEIVGGYYDRTATLVEHYRSRALAVGQIAEAPVLSYFYRRGAVAGTRETNAWLWAASEAPLALNVGTGLSVALGGTVNNPASLTIRAYPVTGLFTGTFRAYYGYDSGAGVRTLYKTFGYAGALVPQRADLSDSVEGRGFFLAPDTADNGKYLYNRSYDFVIEGVE